MANASDGDFGAEACGMTGSVDAFAPRRSAAGNVALNFRFDRESAVSETYTHVEW